MKIKSLIVALIAFCSSSALAYEEKQPKISPFIAIGLAGGNDTIEAYDPNTLFLRSIENSQTSANLFGEIGFKINIKTFFIAPRVGIYSPNENLEIVDFNGNKLTFSSSNKIDIDLLFGMYYKKAAFYFFFGASTINYDNMFEMSREIKIKPVNFGIGFEYYLSKKTAFFAELVGYYAYKDSIKIRVENVELSDNQKALLDTKFYGTKLKLGTRFYPIG